MLDTYPGPIRDEENKAYLRPETAQGIFLEFRNVVDTTPREGAVSASLRVGKSFPERSDAAQTSSSARVRFRANGVGVLLCAG